MAIQVDPTVSPRIILVPETDGDSITVQSLVNQCRDWEDEQANMSYPSLIRASGKDDLGESVAVGITAVLENVLLKAAARSSPTIFSVGGGNLLSEDVNGYKVFPFAPSTNVSYDRAKSSSATISTEIWNLLLPDNSNDGTFGAAIKKIKDQTISVGHLFALHR